MQLFGIVHYLLEVTIIINSIQRSLSFSTYKAPIKRSHSIGSAFSPPESAFSSIRQTINNQPTNNLVRIQIGTLHFHQNKETMPRGIKKENLQSKVCVTCGRPFTWRKKWESCWDDVTTCSKSCNRKRKEGNASERFLAKREELRSHGIENVHGKEVSSSCKCSEANPLHTSENFVQNEETEVELLFNDAEETYINNFDFREENENQTSFDKISDDITNSPNLIEIGYDTARKKALRKAEKKRKKQERRAEREGRGNKSAGQKECDMCGKSVDLLIRCTYDSSLKWNMVCGKCWNTVSGGVIDGDANHPHYKYGGVWKNRRRK